MSDSGQTDQSLVDGLAAAAADGKDVDWAAARAQTTDANDLRLIRELEILSSLVKALRSDSAEPPSPDAPSPEQSTKPKGDSTEPIGNATTWGPMQIVAEIGRGSFGRVYRAWEPRLQREVALKLLDRVAPGTEDIAVTEARLLARVRHENIVTVFGADHFDNQVGFWMECIDGRTLRQMYDEQGSFSAAEALLIGGQICRALAAVHRAGFAHGDVKAHNVMRQSGGRIVLMDFGAARLIAPTTQQLTITPLYVAPELLSGGAPTARSDIYSLGVLLYFLVTGSFPVYGESITDVRLAHASGRRTLLRDVRPDLPSPFIRVVDAATAALPEDRPDSAGALEAIIESAADRGVTARGAKRVPGSDPQHDASVAVLPFADLSEDQSLAYFCHGIAEEIIDALARAPGLRVMAYTSAFAADAQTDPQHVASTLNVKTILQGSVRSAGKRLRISARLTDAATGVQLWSEQFIRELSDIFGVQDEIARAAVRELGVRLRLDRTVSPQPASARHGAEAYTLYLKGRYFWNQRTEMALQKSAACFHAAIEKEPDYGEALAALAETYTTLGLYGVLAPHDIMPRAKEAAERAIEIAPYLSSPYATAACIVGVYEWEWDEAARQFHRALEVNPSDPAAHHWYAINYLVPLRRFEEAAAELRRAAETDPLSTPIRASFGMRSYFAHEFDRATTELREMVEADAGSTTARLFLGLTLTEMGRHEDAIRELETAVHLARSPEMTAGLAYACARTGDSERARALLDELTALAVQRYISPSLIAQVHAGLDDVDAAIEWLQRATLMHAIDLAWLAVRPVFDGLRADPRFNKFLAQMRQ
jgi:serine/threonine-protein kinase